MMNIYTISAIPYIVSLCKTYPYFTVAILTSTDEERDNIFNDVIEYIQAAQATNKFYQDVKISIRDYYIKTITFKNGSRIFFIPNNELVLQVRGNRYITSFITEGLLSKWNCFEEQPAIQHYKIRRISLYTYINSYFKYIKKSITKLSEGERLI